MRYMHVQRERERIICKSNRIDSMNCSNYQSATVIREENKKKVMKVMILFSRCFIQFQTSLKI